ncbi:Hexadecenal dehydrogenase [Marasmius sp. AFHP31]|nr:Hexadecenal dehydrogenase [Marasmius sp. AFHP31]
MSSASSIRSQRSTLTFQTAHTLTNRTVKSLPDPPPMIGDIYSHDVIPAMHADLIHSFTQHSSLTNHGKLTCIRSRKRQLLALARMIRENEECILKNELGRPQFETQVYEIASTLKEVHQTFKGLEKWARGGKQRGKGVVLIIPHSSYPLYTSFVPLASAIAAGNCAVLHIPSGHGWMGELVGKYMDPDVVRAIETPLETLLPLTWAHIHFTGTRDVGKLIACAAARHLTPTTLHLAGKSPLFLDSTSMSTRTLVRAARKILLAKSVNAGQTIGVPDWVFVLGGEEERVVQAFQNAHAKLFPNGSPPPAAFTRLVDTEAFDHVDSLLNRTKGQIVIGGETVREKRYVAPTVVRGVPSSDVLLQNKEGMMAPIIPIVPVERWEDAVEFLEKEEVRTVYVFSRDRAFRKRVLQTTKSTNVVINQTFIHGLHSSVGRAGFDTFSHHRGVLGNHGHSGARGSGFFHWILPTPLRYPYPPYSDAKLGLVKIAMFGSLGGPRFPAHV